jgi:hypothetical protein
MKILLFILVISILIQNIGFAQDVDTTKIEITYDSLIPYDSLNIDSDTLTELQKSDLLFQLRQSKFKNDQKQKLLPRISYYDSLLTHFTSERMNLRKHIDRSYYRDAGDYFRSDPSFMVVDYEPSAKRKLVYISGLPQAKIGAIHNGMNIEPFEHLVIPDGKIDFNDIPTALDDRVYILPGMIGTHFGSIHKITTLLTAPKKLTSFKPETSIMHDHGTLGYDFTRGKYSKLFSSGKEVDVSLEYRNADGLFFNLDDSYQFTGQTVLPLNRTINITASGLFMKKESYLQLFDDFSTDVLIRKRIERLGKIAIEKQNSTHTVKHSLGHRYHKKNSELDSLYKSRIDIYKYDLFYNLEGVKNNTFYNFELDGSYEKFHEGFTKYTRYYSEFKVNLLRVISNLNWAITAGVSSVENYDVFPNLAMSIKHETSKNLFLLSVGVSHRAPSLSELYLPERSSLSIVKGNTIVNLGNENLIKEKLISGSVLIELGSPEKNISLSSTGGAIKDAIEWRGIVSNDTSYYQPSNEDVDFFNSKIELKSQLNKWLYFKAGSAYNFVEYKTPKQNPYTPKYQIYTSAELNYYWKQKFLNLNSFGELVYSDEYVGRFGGEYGNKVIFNAKFSFQIKRFRFHYVFQNIAGTEYNSYEGITIPGRYSYYGITWNFID